MGAIEGRTWLELLSPPECRRLLASRSLGRLAYITGGHPEVLPVNYGLDGDSIVLRTDPGTKFRSALTHPVVAFEIDDASGDDGIGWSVLIVGRASRVTDPAEIERLDRLGVRPLAYGQKGHWIRIEPISVTGRRILLSPSS